MKHVGESTLFTRKHRVAEIQLLLKEDQDEPLQSEGRFRVGMGDQVLKGCEFLPQKTGRRM